MEELVFDTCALSIDMHSDTDEDTTTFRQIAVEAGTIMLACIAQPPHFGGTQYVGPRNVMNVSIFGIPNEAPSVLPLPTVKGLVRNISSERHSVER